MLTVAGKLTGAGMSPERTFQGVVSPPRPKIALQTAFPELPDYYDATDAAMQQARSLKPSLDYTFDARMGSGGRLVITGVRL
jgi:hypothetical protein